jgi:hypothetical protein
MWKIIYSFQIVKRELQMVLKSAFLKPFTSTAANILQIISSNALEIRFGLYFGMQSMPKLKRLL